MNAISKIFLILPAVTLMSCTTNSTRERIVRDMLIAGTVGAAIGYQKDSNQLANATMYAAVTASSVALVDLYLLDPDKEAEKLRQENTKLKNQLDLISNPKVVFETPATFNSKIPDRYKRLINPGEWKIAEIDTWVDDGDNRLIHQDKIMELIPPTLKPNPLGGSK